MCDHNAMTPVMKSRGVGTNLCDSWPVISGVPFAKERCTCSLVKRCSCPGIIDEDARQKHRSSEQGHNHRGVDLYFPFEIERATYCWFLSVMWCSNKLTTRASVFIEQDIC